MNTRFIEAFLQVARLKSFRAAADHLHLTQAAISKRLVSLEEELGTRLFERETRGLKLTSAGARLLEYGERMLDLEREMQLLAKPESHPIGLVRIGAVDSIIHTWLLDFLRTLQSTYPSVAVQLTSENTAGVYKALNEGQVDIALHTHQVDGNGITSIPCLPISLGWIGPLNKSTTDEDSLEHILRSPTITMGLGSHPHHALRELYRRAGLPIGHIHHISSIPAIVQLVRAGFGNALLPLAAVRSEVEARMIRIVAWDGELPHQPLVVSYTDSRASSSIRAIAELARQECDRYVRALPKLYSGE